MTRALVESSSFCDTI